MKNAKLTIGIVSIVLSIIILFQSCAAGISNALANSREASGSAGAFLAILMLIAGIVGIVTRTSKGGAITCGIFYFLGGIIGVANVGTYKDLQVWSNLAFIFAAIFIVSVFVGQTYPSKNEKVHPEGQPVDSNNANNKPV